MIEPLKYCVKLFVQIKQYMNVQEFELLMAVTWRVVINQKHQTNKVRDTDKRFPQLWRLIISWSCLRQLSYLRSFTVITPTPFPNRSWRQRWTTELEEVYCNSCTKGSGCNSMFLEDGSALSITELLQIE